MFEGEALNRREPLPGERFHNIEELVDDMVAHERDPNDLSELKGWWSNEAELAKSDPLRREPFVRLVAEKTRYLDLLGHADPPLGSFLSNKARELQLLYPEEWQTVSDKFTTELTA